MPKVAINNDIYEQKNITANIRYYSACKGYNTATIAKRLGWQPQKYNRKIRNPDKMLLGDLQSISKVLGIETAALFQKLKPQEINLIRR